MVQLTIFGTVSRDELECLLGKDVVIHQAITIGTMSHDSEQDRTYVDLYGTERAVRRFVSGIQVHLGKNTRTIF